MPACIHSGEGDHCWHVGGALLECWGTTAGMLGVILCIVWESCSIWSNCACPTLNVIGSYRAILCLHVHMLVLSFHVYLL